MMVRTGCILAAGLLAFVAASAHGADAAPLTPAQTDFFEKKVRPLLIERCYKCHATDSDKVRGHLLLDSRQGWAKGGDSGPVIVPGKPDDSLLIEAVRYGNEDTAMPPKGKLPQAEIDILVEWVKMGAPDPRTGAAITKGGIDIEKGRQHWAYQPIAKTSVPAVMDAAWPRGEIDRYILARLEKENLRPTKDADRVTLIRRLYFDLIGLPPTPEQIDAFVNDKSPNAYEKVVDGLLASRHYGERWGRHWLDVARFAESLTLRGFILTDAWRYRDYVVEAFNQDRPFDRFMMEQVAGDLMTSSDWQERRRQIVASAYLALGNNNLEDQDKQALVMDVVDEQLDAISKGFLAQTVTCARCHDHKFDPIPTADYYALAGIFKSTRTLNHSNVSMWLQMPLPVDAKREGEIKVHEAKVAAMQADIKALKSTLAQANPARELPANATSRPTVVAVKALSGIVVDDAQAKRVGEWTHSTHVTTYVGDGYLHDDNKDKGTKTLSFIAELPESGKYEVRIAYTTGASRATNTPVTVMSADGEKVIRLNQREPGNVDGRFQSLGQFNFEKGGQSFVLISNEGTNGHVIADAVQFIPADDAKTAATTKEIAQDAAKPDKPDKADKNTKVAAKEKSQPKDSGEEEERKALAERVKAMEADLKKLEGSGPKRDIVVSIRDDDKTGDTRVHVRGSVHNLGPDVPRGFLSVVPVSEKFDIPGNESGRLQLAQWLAHKDNPLPARVMANRAWHHLMGTGLVRTVDNFGTTGENPSHPELLDYLASQLRDNGWSVKRLVKQIVMSRTYQLSSATNAGGLKSAFHNPAPVDPENRLLAHANRRRLDAECIRDAMLMVSGQLDLTPGGQSYKEGMSSDFGFKQTGSRRSVYESWFRNGLPELLEVFDVADPSMPTGRRNVSTVATQALFMMNHPWVQEQSKAAAAKLLKEPYKDDAARLTQAYRATLGRAPTKAEAAIALEYVREAASGGKATEAQAAWANVFHAMFASMDFRYVE
ncbi:MAG: DUF1553 domain-containing protein [Phycisphaeraceae bacterium]